MAGGGLLRSFLRCHSLLRGNIHAFAGGRDPVPVPHSRISRYRPYLLRMHRVGASTDPTPPPAPSVFLPRSDLSRISVLELQKNPRVALLKPFQERLSDSINRAQVIPFISLPF